MLLDMRSEMQLLTGLDVILQACNKGMLLNVHMAEGATLGTQQ